ncbi:MAG: DUF3199 family protein [Clostridiales bacterium]|nr:DUF3199 family protein [Clostridiales bacterium]
MADRPWVSPLDIKEYTEYKQVKSRRNKSICIDIARAEQYVVSYTNNDFSEYEELPNDVKTAVILLAEAYAYNSCADSNSGGRRMKSESFDDYSYSSDSAYIDLDELDVKVLLEPYVKVSARNGVTMRMRKL